MENNLVTTLSNLSDPLVLCSSCSQFQPTIAGGSARTAGETTTEIQEDGVVTTAANNPEAAITTTAKAPTAKEEAEPAGATVSPRYQTQILCFLACFLVSVVCEVTPLNYCIIVDSSSNWYKA